MDYKVKGGQPAIGTINDLGFNASKHQMFVGIEWRQSLERLRLWYRL
jgi:hypothetical protein